MTRYHRPFVFNPVFIFWVSSFFQVPKWGLGFVLVPRKYHLAFDKSFLWSQKSFLTSQP